MTVYCRYLLTSHWTHPFTKYLLSYLPKNHFKCLLPALGSSSKRSSLARSSRSQCKKKNPVWFSSLLWSEKGMAGYGMRSAKRGKVGEVGAGVGPPLQPPHCLKSKHTPVWKICSAIWFTFRFTPIGYTTLHRHAYCGCTDIYVASW